MNLPLSWKRIEHALIAILIAVYAVAMIAYLFHAIETNPQYDNQGMWYATEMRDALAEGHVKDFLLESRKYPMFYIIPQAVAQALFLTVADAIGPVATDAHLFFLARFVTMLYSIGTFIVLFFVSKRMTGNASAAIILLCSLLFFLFATAIRPHLPAAFWTLATLAASLRMYESPTLRRSIVTWVCAIIAFGTLQSGIFAFIFPFWASLQDDWRWRNITRSGLTLCCTGLIALIIGYPFVLGSMFGNGEAVSADLGHYVGLTYDILRPFFVSKQLIGSELIVIIFAVAGVVRMKKKLDPVHPAVFAVLFYIIAFCAMFILHTSTVSRFFLPMLPLLALLGARAYDATPIYLRAVVLGFMILIFGKFTWLALQENTYERAGAFSIEREGKIAVAIKIPDTFTGVPRNRRPLTDAEIYEAKTYILTDEKIVTAFASIEPCAHFIASPTTNEIVLLWNDTPWALYRVLEAKMLGPNISVYCRE